MSNGILLDHSLVRHLMETLIFIATIIGMIILSSYVAAAVVVGIAVCFMGAFGVDELDFPGAKFLSGIGSILGLFIAIASVVGYIWVWTQII